MTFAIGIAVNLIWTTSQPRPVAVDYSNAEFGTLKWRILDAKAKGQNRVELSVLGCGWDIGSLQTALSRDTVVLAELVGKKTYEDRYGLHTVYRFKTKETLVEHPNPYPKALTYTAVPSDMLPIAEDEFLIRETNGQMEIDGITVTQDSNGAQYFEDQTYLLFVWIDPSRRTAIRTATDPLGVFLVDSDGNLSSYLKRPYPLKTELEKQFKNSVNNLRHSLKK